MQEAQNPRESNQSGNANRLTTLLMDKEKFFNTWRACLKRSDGNENGNGNESDVENRHIKKVRFSPETETIEFEKSEAKFLEIKARGRQKSVINKVAEKVTELAYGVGNITMEKRVAQDDKGNKSAENADNEEHGMVTRRSLRTREVVDEKKRENVDVNKGLKKTGRSRNLRKGNVKGSEDITESREIDAKCESDVENENGYGNESDVENRHVKKVRFSPETETIEFEKSDAKFLEIKTRGRRKSVINKECVAEKVTEPVYGVRNITMEKRADRDDAVGNKLATSADSEEHGLVTRRSLRNREVLDEKRRENEDVNKDLKKNGVPRNPRKRNVKDNKDITESRETDAECESVQPEKVLRRAGRNAKKVQDYRLLTKDAMKNEVVDRGKSRRAEATMVKEVRSQTRVLSCSAFVELESVEGSDTAGDQISAGNLSSANSLRLIDLTDSTDKRLLQTPASRDVVAEDVKQEGSKKILGDDSGKDDINEKYPLNFENAMTEMISGNGHDTQVTEFGNNEELTSTVNSGKTLEQREQSPTMQRNGFLADNAAEEDKTHHYEEVNCKELPNSDEDRPLEEQYDSPNKCWECSVSDHFQSSATRMLQDGITNVDKNASEEGGNGDLIEWSNEEKFTSAIKDDKYKHKLVNSEEPIAATISGACESQVPEFDNEEKLANTMNFDKTMEQRVQSPTNERKGFEADNAAEEYVNCDQEKLNSGKLPKPDEYRSLGKHYDSPEKCQESSISDHSRRSTPRVLQDGSSNGGEESSWPADLLDTFSVFPSVADKNVEKQCRVIDRTPSISGLGSTDHLESNLPSNGSEIIETSSMVVKNEPSRFPDNSVRNQEEIADGVEAGVSPTMPRNDVEADDLAVAYNKSQHVNNWTNLAKYEDENIDLGKCSPSNMLNSSGSKLGVPDVNDGEGSLNDSYSRGVVLAAQESAAYITEGDWALDESGRIEKVDSIQALYAGKTELTIEYEDLGRQNICLADSLNNATDELNDQLRSTTESLNLEGTTSACEVTRENEIFSVNMGESNTVNSENLTPSITALEEYGCDHEEEVIVSKDLEKGLENIGQSLTRCWNSSEAHSVAETDRNVETEELYLFEFTKFSEDRTSKGLGDSPVKCWESVSGSHISDGENFLSAAASEGKNLVYPHVAAKRIEMKHEVTEFGEIISHFANAGLSEASSSLEFRDSEVASCMSMCEHSQKDGNAALIEPRERERFVSPIKDGFFTDDPANPEDVMAAMTSGTRRSAQVPIESDNDGNAAHIESDNDGNGMHSEGRRKEQTDFLQPSDMTKRFATNTCGDESSNLSTDGDNIDDASKMFRVDKLTKVVEKLKNVLLVQADKHSVGECDEEKEEATDLAETATEVLSEAADQSFANVDAGPEDAQIYQGNTEVSIDSAGRKYKQSIGECDEEKEEATDLAETANSEAADQSLANDDEAPGDAQTYLGKIDSVESKSSDDGSNISTAKKFKSAGKKKNMRTILIHGTPNKLQIAGDMKENFPCSKMESHGSLTTVRPTAKRSALKDLLQK